MSADQEWSDAIKASIGVGDGLSHNITSGFSQDLQAEFLPTSTQSPQGSSPQPSPDSQQRDTVHPQSPLTKHHHQSYQPSQYNQNVSQQDQHISQSGVPPSNMYSEPAGHTGLSTESQHHSSQPQPVLNKRQIRPNMTSNNNNNSHQVPNAMGHAQGFQPRTQQHAPRLPGSSNSGQQPQNRLVRPPLQQIRPATNAISGPRPPQLPMNSPSQRFTRPPQMEQRPPFHGNNAQKSSHNIRMALPTQNQTSQRLNFNHPLQQNPGLRQPQPMRSANPTGALAQGGPGGKMVSQNPSISRQQAGAPSPGQMRQTGHPQSQPMNQAPRSGVFHQEMRPPHPNRGGRMPLPHQGYPYGQARMAQQRLSSGGEHGTMEGSESHEPDDMYFDDEDDYYDEDMEEDEEEMYNQNYMGGMDYGYPGSDSDELSDEESALLEELNSCENGPRYEEIMNRLREKGVDADELDEMMYHRNMEYGQEMYPEEGYIDEEDEDEEDEEDEDEDEEEGAEDERLVTSSSQGHLGFHKNIPRQPMLNQRRPPQFSGVPTHSETSGGSNDIQGSQNRMFVGPSGGQNIRVKPPGTGQGHNLLSPSTNGFNQQSMSSGQPTNQKQPNKPPASQLQLASARQSTPVQAGAPLPQVRQQQSPLKLVGPGQQSKASPSPAGHIPAMNSGWQPVQNIMKSPSQMGEMRSPTPKAIPQTGPAQMMPPPKPAQKPAASFQGQPEMLKPQAPAQVNPPGIVLKPIQHLIVSGNVNQPNSPGQVNQNKITVQQSPNVQPLVISPVSSNQQAGTPTVVQPPLVRGLQPKASPQVQQSFGQGVANNPNNGQISNQGVLRLPGLNIQANLPLAPQQKSALPKESAPSEATLARLTVEYMQQSLDEEIMAKKGVPNMQGQQIAPIQQSGALPSTEQTSQSVPLVPNQTLRPQQQQNQTTYQPKHQLPPRQPIPAILDPNFSSLVPQGDRPVCSVVPFTTQNKAQLGPTNQQRPTVPPQQSQAQPANVFVKPRNPPPLPPHSTQQLQGLVSPPMNHPVPQQIAVSAASPTATQSRGPVPTVPSPNQVVLQNPFSDQPKPQVDLQPQQLNPPQQLSAQQSIPQHNPLQQHHHNIQQLPHQHPSTQQHPAQQIPFQQHPNQHHPAQQHLVQQQQLLPTQQQHPAQQQHSAQQQHPTQQQHSAQQQYPAQQQHLPQQQVAQQHHIQHNTQLHAPSYKPETFSLDTLSEEKCIIKSAKGQERLKAGMIYQIRSPIDQSMVLALWNGERFEDLNEADLKDIGAPGKVPVSCVGKQMKQHPDQKASTSQAMGNSEKEKAKAQPSQAINQGISKFQTAFVQSLTGEYGQDDQSLYSEGDPSFPSQEDNLAVRSEQNCNIETSHLRNCLEQSSNHSTYVKPLSQCQIQKKEELKDEENDDAIFKKPYPEQEDYFRVCNYCGYTSKDFKRCEGCKKIFQGEMKVHTLKKNTGGIKTPAPPQTGSGSIFKVNGPEEYEDSEQTDPYGGAPMKTEVACGHRPTRGRGRRKGMRGSGRTRGGGMKGRMGARGGPSSDTDDSMEGHRNSDTSENSGDSPVKKRPARPKSKNPNPRKRAKKQDEPVTLTISSDEDEPSSTSNNILGHAPSPAHSGGSESPLFPSTPTEPINAFGRFRKFRMEDEDGASKMSKKIQQRGTHFMDREMEEEEEEDEDDDDEVPIYEIDIRSVRIGSMRTQPEGPLLINLRGVCFKVKSERTEEPFECEILATDVTHVKYFAGQTQPVLFLFLTHECGEKLRNICHMEKGDDEYFDPSSTDMKQKMVVIIVECFNYMPQGMLRETLSLWADINHEEDMNYIEELTEESANDLLIQSAPPVLTADVEHDVMKFKRRYLRSSQDKDHMARAPLSPSDSTDNEPDSTSSSPPEVKHFFGSNVRLLQYPPPPLRGIPITTEDIWCLTEGEFLNDVIIDFYLQYLYLEKFSPENRKRTHIFSSFFYKRLTQRDRHLEKTEEDAKKSLPERRHARVKKWTKTVDLFSKDFIIVPINEHSHWYLAVICFPGIATPEIVQYVPNTAHRGEGEDESNDTQTILGRQLDPHEAHEIKLEGVKQPCILMFDSLAGPSRNPNIKMLKEYLQCEWNAKRPDSEPRNLGKIVRGSSPKVPQQSNYSDCGVYLLQYVESFFEDPIGDFQIPMKGLQNWFPEELVLYKRRNIHELIMSLHKKYSEERGERAMDIKFESTPREPVMRINAKQEDSAVAGSSRDDDSSNSSMAGDMTKEQSTSIAPPTPMDENSSSETADPLELEKNSQMNQDYQQDEESELAEDGGFEQADGAEEQQESG